MKPTALILAMLALCCLPPAPAVARPELPSSIPAPSALCRTAIMQAERAAHLPDRLLDAIAMVESGRRDPVSGAVYPWPWTINVEGEGHFYETKAEAIAAVQAFQARGARSIDVGCMQVSLLYHANAFASLDQAFDPTQNAAYAAHFLLELYGQTNAWPRAAAAYHSQTPDIGADYARKVIAAWGVPLPPVDGQSIQFPSANPFARAGATASQPPLAPPAARVAVVLPSGAEAIRVQAIPGGGGAMMTGRGLDTYRAAPIGLAVRMPRAG